MSMVGIAIASMIASALNRIIRFAPATAPAGSRMLAVPQPVSTMQPNITAEASWRRLAGLMVIGVARSKNPVVIGPCCLAARHGIKAYTAAMK